MADGHEIRADIDTETVKGLQLILGGSAAGLLAALPHVLETPRVSTLAPWMVAATAWFALGLVLSVVHNRLRRKCSLEYSRADNKRGTQIGLRWRRFQSVPGEPRVCTHSVMFLWGSIGTFVIGAAIVIVGAARLISHVGPLNLTPTPSHPLVESTTIASTSGPAQAYAYTWFELIKNGIPAAVVALGIGYAGVRIASRQAITAEAKLKLDLFEKRYAIFLETWTILSEVVISGTRTKNYGLGNPFSNFIPQARFLFGRDVENYLFGAVKHWAELNGVEGDLSGPGPRDPDLARKRAELTTWFHEQADSGLKSLFGPYLDFEKWK